MGKNKAVILDRDGTINVDAGYVGRKEDFVYLDGAIDGLKALTEANYCLIVVTNQSGIARGYYTEAQFKALNEWMIEDLRTKGITITATYYCPHHPEATVEAYRIDCDCRKPKLGMFEKAIAENDININDLYVIGDKNRDVALCDKYESVHGIVLYSGLTEQRGNIEYISGGLREASKRVLGNNYGKLD